MTDTLSEHAVESPADVAKLVVALNERVASLKAEIASLRGVRTT